MKLEVGMYARTKNFGIGKITKIEPFLEKYTHIYLDCGKGDITYQTKDCIFKVNSPESTIKAGFDIIDLIEEGDYVNGWRVNKIEKDEDGTLLTVGTLTSFVSRNEQDPYLTQDYNEADKICKIKSIITHEQMERMEYKVE